MVVCSIPSCPLYLVAQTSPFSCTCTDSSFQYNILLLSCLCVLLPSPLYVSPILPMYRLGDIREEVCLCQLDNVCSHKVRRRMVARAGIKLSRSRGCGVIAAQNIYVDSFTLPSLRASPRSTTTSLTSRKATGISLRHYRCRTVQLSIRSSF